MELDDPPARVEPILMLILLCAAELCTCCDHDMATINCIWMAFYFLLRPGEYAYASGDAKHPFRLCDVQYKIGNMHFFYAHLTTLQQCLASTFVSLTFSTPKNGVKGEKLAHTPTGHPISCPVRATHRLVAHLILHNSPPSTPLHHVYYDDAGRKRAVSSSMITSLLRTPAALTIPGHAGVDVNNIAARSLRSSGAILLLLLGGMDTDRIRILGRWNSDAMFRYLHAHALPLIFGNASLMFQAGHYELVTARRP